MQSWKRVWQNGLAPHLSVTGLLALRNALILDDERLIQGATTSPPPLEFALESEVESCCALGFCAWQGSEKRTVADVEDDFARVCLAADQALGEPCACRWFLNWYDETARDEMRRALLPEVELALNQRALIETRGFHENAQSRDDELAMVAV